MARLQLRDPSTCKYDEVSLGEIMLRLDPGDRRIRTARTFEVWEGGGEYNVARALRKCFGLRTAVATAFPENDVAHLAEELILAGGVDTSWIKWVPYDGIGAGARVGLNFTERGFGVRGALGVSDRAHSAASLLQPGDLDFERLFSEEGARWFHTGGIYAALSDSTPAVIEEAMAAAHEAGTIISYDLNYRPSLWKSRGGLERCRAVNRRLARYVDVIIGNEEDFTACLGLEVEGLDASMKALPVEGYRKMIGRAVEEFPNFKACATTLRTVKTASVNDWSAICWYDGEFHQAPEMKDLAVYDRVGGGDSFASGLVYGFLEWDDARKAVCCGCAHGALAMTTPGDVSMASKAEVMKLMSGGSARVVR